MATISATILLCCVMAILVVVDPQAASHQTDFAGCSENTSMFLNMTTFLQSFPLNSSLDMYVTALTRELLPNTTSMMLSVKSLSPHGYLMTTTANVRGASGDLQCSSINHTLRYNAQRRRLESELDVNSCAIHVHLLGNDAVKGHTAFYVHVLRDGVTIKNQTFIDLLTSDPSTRPSLHWPTDAVQGACNGTDVTFNSLPVNTSMGVDCGPGAVCSLPSITGPCRARLTRYYFDNRRGACFQFTYGGCRGNANNFKSSAQCLRVCRPQ
ncbi:uncharacterized protein [Littorina saxatilis]|uniref:uncharacterized protein n=1 Tax=Littorina saxatilis TaxID=31220 RepID=UPI0038B4D723